MKWIPNKVGNLWIRSVSEIPSLVADTTDPSDANQYEKGRKMWRTVEEGQHDKHSRRS